MIEHITDTKTADLNGVYFEDIDALVSDKKEAWLVYTFLYYYFSTECAAEKFTREKHKGNYRFVYGVGYGVGMQENSQGEQYNLFDWGDIPIDCNPKDEWNWVEWGKVAETHGITIDDLLSEPLPMLVFDLISYYGHENIFGSSYYPFEIRTRRDKWN